MSSSTVFEPGFGNSRQRNRWWVDYDGAFATTLDHENEDIVVNWSLIDWLASAETVSSAAYEDSGVTTSGKSVSTPVVIFTMTGIGETRVEVTTSLSRNKSKIWRTYPVDKGGARSDYGE